MSAERSLLSVRARWQDFWFSPAEARALGLCRVAFYGILLAYYWTYDFSVWALAPASFWDPTAPFLLFGLPRLSFGAIALLQVLWKVALLLACLGIGTRFASAASFLLGLYLIGFMRNISPTHTDEALIVVLGIMALARSGDACTLPGWLFRRGHRATPAPSGDYRWPLQLIRVMAILPLFAAGISKLRHSGLEWVFSDTLSIVLLQSARHATFPDPATSWGSALAPHVWLCQLLAGGALLLELTVPLALVSARARAALVPGALLLLIGFRLLLGPNFAPLMICYVAWLPWPWLADTTARYWRLARTRTLRFPIARRPALAPAVAPRRRSR